MTGHCLSLLVSAFAAAVIGLQVTAATSAADLPVNVITFGDSLINGYGIGEKEKRFSAQMKAALAADGYVVTFTDWGYVDNSAFGLRRLTGAGSAYASFLANPAGHVVILDLGQNDCVGFMKLDQTAKNLDQILQTFAAAGVPVLVVGTQPYDWCAPEYVAGFPKMNADVAGKYHDLFYDDFKRGVTGHPELLQGDADHPNAEGEAVIVANMVSSVEALLDRTKPAPALPQ